MPLINPCFGCRRRLQSSRRAEQEPRHCLTPSVPLRLAGGFGRILREGMSLLLHWGSTTRSRADKRQRCLPLPSTRPVLGAVTRKEGERHRSLSGAGADPSSSSVPPRRATRASPTHRPQPASQPSSAARERAAKGTNALQMLLALEKTQTMNKLLKQPDSLRSRVFTSSFLANKKP